MEFEVINTQEEFDARIKDRLDRERDKYDKKLKDYEAYKKLNDELNAKIVELTKNLEGFEASKKENVELKTKVAKYESDSVKTRIANEFDIPYELASRLSGETEEDIRKDAQAISGYLAKKQPQAPAARSEEKAIKDKDSSLKRLAKGLFEGEE